MRRPLDRRNSNWMTTTLKRALWAVTADPRRRSQAELRIELRSRDRDRRVRALLRIRHQIERSGLREGYFDLARKHVCDSDSTCRWQATIVIGEFIPTQRDRVWGVALELAKSRVADVRMASSTVLLEHLLECHPRIMIPRFRTELAQGSEMFRRSVGSCWNFGNARTRRPIQRLIDEARAV
jgi:hypothetical protein